MVDSVIGFVRGSAMGTVGNSKKEKAAAIPARPSVVPTKPYEANARGRGLLTFKTSS